MIIETLEPADIDDIVNQLQLSKQYLDGFKSNTKTIEADRKDATKKIAKIIKHLYKQLEKQRKSSKVATK